MTTTCATRLFLIVLLAFVIMRIFYLFYLKNDPLEMENDEKEQNSKHRVPSVITEQNISKIMHKIEAKQAMFGEKLNTTRIKPKKKYPGKSVGTPYQDWENVVETVSVEWSKFVSLPMQAPRNKHVIKSNVLRGLRKCTGASLTNSSCGEVWSDSFVTSWRERRVKDLCEEGANSKIMCYDSLGSKSSRFCVFDNAMMDFRKVRRRKQQQDSNNAQQLATRSWERGFLSADCGEMAKDDIGYLPMYKPDIEGQGEALCDVVFNETVLAYSHDNTRNFGQMTTDYLNVWAMLWLSGTSQQARDISFLNIDALKKGGRYVGDQPNQFFSHYNVTFRRVIKAADFAESGARVCFKRLIMQPRPTLHFQFDGNGVAGKEAHCSYSSGSSSLFQRFNLQLRHNYGLLDEDWLTQGSGSKILILLITRAIRPSASAAPAHLTSRLFRNADEIESALRLFATDQSSAELPVELVVRDLASMPFEEQVRLIASASLVVGMHGAGIASSMHMAVGSKHCCGVVEIFPQGEYRPIRGYGNMARRMGHHYERLELSSENSRSNGGEVPPEQVKAVVVNMLSRIEARPSCLLPSVLDDPHFSSVPGVWDN